MTDRKYSMQFGTLSRRERERMNSPYSKSLENYRDYVMSNPMPNSSEVRELKEREAKEDAQRKGR